MYRLIAIPAIVCATATLSIDFQTGEMRSGILSVQTAEAQQMGKSPWSPGPRNRSLAAQFDHAEKLAEANRPGSFEQYVYNHTYSSTSNSVGNLSEINQILSGGSTGTVDQGTDQTSSGDQDSTGTTDVVIDSQTTSTASENGGAENTSANVDGGDTVD
ncbi:hypothetical protein [Fodinicurvata sp. EGI_FJ10296]|uniref:hypothetical protein n=1 Tax=Fodinicurvata sp. EGI_FJ10296 TaxID=3231908 RepID=UPI00345536E4